MSLFIITFLIFGAVLAAMSVGVIFGNRRISGSCGGMANEDGLPGSCEICGWSGNPDDGPGELCIDGSEDGKGAIRQS